MNAWEFGEVKFRKCIDRYRPYLLNRLGATEEALEKATLATTLALIPPIAIPVLERAVEEQNAAIALTFVEVARGDNDAEEIWKELSPEEQDFAWRYLDLFLKIITNKFVA